VGHVGVLVLVHLGVVRVHLRQPAHLLPSHGRLQGSPNWPSVCAPQL
jgi:hypothetical protein